MGELVLFPTGVGDVRMLSSAPNVSPDNWQNVNEWPPDGEASIVYRDGEWGWDYDLYRLTLPSPPPSGPISKISHRMYCDCYLSGYAKHCIKTHGLVYPSSQEWFIINYDSELVFDWLVNPYTGQSWTWSEIATLQFGPWLCSSHTGSIQKCTSVRIGVSFTEEQYKSGSDSFVLADSGVKEVIAAIEKTGSDSLILTDSAKRIISPLVPVAIFVIKERRTERLS